MARKNILDDLLWGLLWGGGLAFVLCCYVVGLYLVRGARPFEANRTTLVMVLAMYAVGGILIGLIVGFLRPLTSRRWGAALIGAIAAVPAFVIVRTGIDGLHSWQTGDTIGMLFFALALGAPLGWIYWGISHSMPGR